MSTNAVATSAASNTKPPMEIGSKGIILAGIDDLWRWSQYVVASGLAPKGMEKPESIFVATQMGLEVGLTPMAAIQNIAPINGRPTLWGDAQLAVVRSTGQLEEFEEWYEANGERLLRNPVTFEESTVAVCRVKRTGYKPTETAFSVADAKRAGLWGKQGPWSQYPARMMKFRARSFGLRDTFGDALKGMISTEEAIDLPAMKNVTPAKVSEIDVPAYLAEPTAPEFEKKPKADKAKPAPVAQPAPVAEPVFETPPQHAEKATPVQSAMNPTKAIRGLLKNAGSTETALLAFLRSSGAVDESMSSLEEIQMTSPSALTLTIDNWSSIAESLKGAAK